MKKTSVLDQIIEIAIEEDVGKGDITTDAIIDRNVAGTGVVKAKQVLIVAGLKAMEKVFSKISKSIICDIKCEDGDKLSEDDLIAVITGPVADLLTAERIALNFLQHLSGIATFANLFVKAVSHTKTKILDTRKTRPGYRELEKEAVKFGDGKNHRMGLYDRYLIKDNHIKVAGSITEAVARINKKRDKGKLIEVEVPSIDDLKEAIDSGVDIVMLDNMSPSEVKKAVEIARSAVELEVSGNISLENIKEYAETGVDYISIGAITHSAPSVDINMTVV